MSHDQCWVSQQLTLLHACCLLDTSSRPIYMRKADRRKEGHAEKVPLRNNEQIVDNVDSGSLAQLVM